MAWKKIMLQVPSTHSNSSVCDIYYITAFLHMADVFTTLRSILVFQPVAAFTASYAG